MPRKIKDAKLDTRTARLKLAPRGKPYFCRVGPDCHLGYRRLKGRDGSWTRRRRDDGKYVTEGIGLADDVSEADGNKVLTFAQAEERCRALAGNQAGPSPFTVADAVQFYLHNLEHGDNPRPAKALADIRYRLEKFVLPELGDVPLSELTEKRLTQWRRTIAMSPRYHKTPAATDDEIRARRATAQRLWQGFHAVLAYAFKKKDDTGVTSNEAWQGIEGLRDIEKPREGALTVPECKRLINAVDAEFRPMVQAALLTGARYGALASLRVKDFDPGSGTVQLQSRKGYGSRLRIHRTVLTAEGVQFFKAACAGRGRNDLIFTRDGGGSWNTSHQQDLVAEACARAGIDPPVTFHELKHTYVSLCLMNGMSIETVSANTATSVPTLLKHYAHLVQAFRVKQVNEHAPTFGIDTGNVAVPP